VLSDQPLAYRAGVGLNVVLGPHAGEDTVHDPQGCVSRWHIAPNLAQDADHPDLTQERALPAPAAPQIGRKIWLACSLTCWASTGISVCKEHSVRVHRSGPWTRARGRVIQYMFGPWTMSILEHDDRKALFACKTSRTTKEHGARISLRGMADNMPRRSRGPGSGNRPHSVMPPIVSRADDSKTRGPQPLAR